MPPIQVTYRHFDPPQSVREKIDGLMQHFADYDDAIIAGDVVVDAIGKHGDKTEVEISIRLDLPKGQAVAKRGADLPSPAGQRSFDTAATEAFRVAVEQVRQHLAKLRPQGEKQLEHQQERGRIERLNEAERNGFVEMPDGISLFFADEVVEGDFDGLSTGDEVMVRRAEDDSPYGPQAAWVRPLGPMTASG